MDVIELFAGVGGFRVGLERANPNFYHIIWSNQWEPATKDQHAWRTYERVYGKGSCDNRDIATVPLKEIPRFDMLVGGFPCQDYSVAKTLRQSEGIKGKKGVLWWEIYRIIEGKVKARRAPTVLFLENVDRLINSPATQRGRDFAVMLQSLANLGYSVEWRIINAADYGMPQRRRRTYILAYRNRTPLTRGMGDPVRWIFHDGVFAHAFPVIENYVHHLNGQAIMGADDTDLADVSQHFNINHPDSRVFENAGVMINGVFYTCRVEADYNGNRTTLGDIVANTPREYITDNFYIPDADIPGWQREKGGKKIPRVNRATGLEYLYSEGGMPFPDPLDRPSRTIITGEGGKAPSRFKHVIEDPVNHRLRRLVPIELEQLDMFPINHTEGETDEKRAFFMGNALVCGIVERVGEELMTRQWRRVVNRNPH